MSLFGDVVGLAAGAAVTMMGCPEFAKAAYDLGKGITDNGGKLDAQTLEKAGLDAFTGGMGIGGGDMLGMGGGDMLGMGGGDMLGMGGGDMSGVGQYFNNPSIMGGVSPLTMSASGMPGSEVWGSQVQPWTPQNWSPQPVGLVPGTSVSPPVDGMAKFVSSATSQANQVLQPYDQSNYNSRTPGQQTSYRNMDIARNRLEDLQDKIGARSGEGLDQRISTIDARLDRINRQEQGAAIPPGSDHYKFLEHEKHHLERERAHLQSAENNPIGNVGGFNPGDPFSIFQTPSMFNISSGFTFNP